MYCFYFSFNHKVFKTGILRNEENGSHNAFLNSKYWAQVRKSSASVDENTILNDGFNVSFVIHEYLAPREENTGSQEYVTAKQQFWLNFIDVLYERQLLIIYDSKIFQVIPSLKLDVAQE